MIHGAYSQYFIFFINYELAQYVRAFVTGKPFQLSVMVQSSLLGQFVSHKENGVLWILYQETNFIKALHYKEIKWVQNKSKFITEDFLVTP
jgi:hypothetical protein